MKKMGNFIADSSVEEFKDWITELEKDEKGPYSVIVLNSFNKDHQNIKEEQEKLNTIFTIIENRRGEQNTDILRHACYNLHEYIVEQLLLRGWDPNKSHGGNIMYTPIKEMISPHLGRVDKEHIESKQKKILLLLIQYGLSFNFLEENSFGWSIHSSIQKNKHHYVYDWIESFQEHFNEKQRKEWKSFRLQRLF